MIKRAFTLAEILISMVIIGVISILMVPVIQNSQDKALEVGTAHFHSMMAQAIRHYLVDNSVESLCDTKMCFKPASNSETGTYFNRTRDEVDDFMYKYLHVAKVCSYDDRYDCVSQTIKTLDGNKISPEFTRKLIYNFDNSTSRSTYSLGSTMKFYVLENGNTIYMLPPTNIRPAVLQVDINGKKGPNRVGRDIWAMSIYADGTVSEGLHRFIMKESYRSNPSQMKSARENLKNDRYNSCRNNYDVYKYGAGCFAKFEDNGFKFDY
ncbi:type II secretion system protein [bacterium]|nr:type II secretion system protein [bacterium]